MSAPDNFELAGKLDDILARLDRLDGRMDRLEAGVQTNRTLIQRVDAEVRTNRTLIRTLAYKVFPDAMAEIDDDSH